MNQVIAEGEGFTEKRNRRQIEMAAERDAEFEAAIEKELLELENGSDNDTKLDETSKVASGLSSPTSASAPVASIPDEGNRLLSDDNFAEEDEELDDRELYSIPYKFPVESLEKEWPDLKAMSVQELADELHNLMVEMSDKGVLLPYNEIRIQSCAINIELNRRGKLAPRFRDMRRPPRIVDTENMRNLSLDRQIIDLHWLHSIGWRRLVNADRLHLRRLCSGNQFPLHIAEMFAEIPASPDEKAGWLSLPDHIAFQLASIQAKRIWKRFYIAEKGDIRGGKVVQLGRRQVVQLLETSVARQPHLQDQVPRWSMIWMCARLVGDQGELLRQFHAVAEGLDKPLDRRDVVRRLSTVEGRLAIIRKSEKPAA